MRCFFFGISEAVCLQQSQHDRDRSSPEKSLTLALAFVLAPNEPLLSFALLSFEFYTHYPHLIIFSLEMECIHCNPVKNWHPTGSGGSVDIYLINP